MTDTRCHAAHPEDPSPCTGPHDAVTVGGRGGQAVPGCEGHAARLLAALEGGHLEPGTVQGAAARVFDAATRTEGQEPPPEVVELSGGPLDGQRLDVTGWTEDERATGVAHLSPHSAHGPGGRSLYGPPEHDPLAPVWRWEGDMP